MKETHVPKNQKAPSEMIPTHYDSSDPKSRNETSGGLTPAGASAGLALRHNRLR